MMVSKLFPMVAAAILLAAGSGRAAEPTAADRETARALMAEGRADRDRGDLKGAVGAFGAADALMHAPTTSLELARTHEAMGDLVAASDIALRVVRIVEKADDPVPYRLAHKAAEELFDDIQQRVPSIKITLTKVADGATPSVTIDGVRLAPELLGYPRKLNPGHYVIEVTQGSYAGMQEVDVQEREFKEVTIDLVRTVRAAQSDSLAGFASTAQRESPAERSSASKVMIYGGFGVTGAAIAVGTTAAALSIAKTHRIRSSAACDGNQCGPSEFGNIESARRMATIATASFIGAGVGAAVAIVGLLTGKEPTPSADTSTEPRLGLLLGIDAAGVRGQF